MNDIREQLLSKAYLYADPSAYTEGVLAALRAVQPDLPADEDPEPRTLVAAGADRNQG